MSLTPISKSFFGVPEDDQDFDLRAATEVYRWYLSDPTAEQVMLHTLAEEIPRLENYHAGEIREAVRKTYEQRKEILKRMVVEGSISKSMTDQSVQAVIEAVDLIEKADNGYTLWERQENTRRQWRDRSGRWRPMGNVTVAPSTGSRMDDAKFNDITPKHFTPAQTKGFNRDAAARYQNAYAQVAGALGNVNTGQNPEMSAVLTWNDGTVQELLGNRPEDLFRPADFKDKELARVDFYTLGESATEPSSTYDAMRSFGMPNRMADEAAYQVNSGALNQGNVKGLNQGLIESANMEQYGESGLTRGFKRLGAASGFAESVFGNSDDPRVKAAIAAGKWAGNYGPEAEKVLGPHARKSAYRYRGVERKPDQRLGNAFRSAVSTATTPSDVRTRIIYPRVKEEVVGRGENRRVLGVPVESPVINYFRSILPREELLHLHTNSGAIAPSQGIIIDSKGGLATQAVGYGDDHYLPFNLKNLKSLKGGEYIRTRTLGGPTTEDVYTGMVSGARAFTVVSHSGVYTVEFADDFRGGRRLNDKSARMVKRYAMLLDSLNAEQVTLTDVPPDRKKELMARALGRFPGDDDAVRASRDKYFHRLVDDERREPKPSAEQKQIWAQEFLDTKAANFRTVSGEEATWNNVRGRMMAQIVSETGDDPEYVAQQFSTPDGAIVASGWGEEYKKYTQTKEREYVAQQKPLKLNGEGYYLALQALQEQFPYYISNVEYRPWEKPSGQTDQGYVKPKYNRARAIKDGFWDPSIEGRKSMAIPQVTSTGEKKESGKVHADETNYQNYYVRQNLGGKKKSDTSEGDDGATPGQPDSPSAGTPGASGAVPGGSLSLREKANYRAKLAKHAQDSATQWSADGKNGKVGDLNQDGLATLAEKLSFPLLMTTDPEELRSQYVSDPSFAKRVDDEARRMMASGSGIAVPQEMKENFDSTGAPKPPVPYSRDSALVNGVKKKQYYTFGDEDDAILGGSEDIMSNNLIDYANGNFDDAKKFVGADRGIQTPGLDVKLADAYIALNDEDHRLSQAINSGQVGRVPFDLNGRAYHTPAEAQAAMDKLVLDVSKLRQAHLRYQDAAKNEAQPIVVQAGFVTTPESQGPNGTKIDPNVPTGFTPEDQRWLGGMGIVGKRFVPVRKAVVKRVRTD